MPRSSRAACLRLLTRLASTGLLSVCGKHICFNSVILRVGGTLIHSADSSASARREYTPSESNTLPDTLSDTLYNANTLSNRLSNTFFKMGRGRGRGGGVEGWRKGEGLKGRRGEWGGWGVEGGTGGRGGQGKDGERGKEGTIWEGDGEGLAVVLPIG